jgi:hypothetical protein
MRAAELIDAMRQELEPVRQRLLAHPYLAAVEAVELPGLRPFAGEQWAIISSDLRSVAQLVARWGGSFFLSVLDGERAALAALPAFAAALGWGVAELEAYEPLPGAHAYTAYMAWLAAQASPAEVAGAYLLNFSDWGTNCGRLSQSLRRRHRLTADQVRFLDLFAEPDPAFESQALAVVQTGLDSGVPERAVRRAARLLQGYELLYWDTLWEALQ